MGAQISGATGDVAFASGTGSEYEELDSHIIAWNARIENDMYPATTFATSDVGKVTEVGMMRIRGSCRGFLDRHTHIATASFAAERHAIASQADLTLTASTGRTYKFPALCNNFAFGVNKQTGLNSLGFDFVSNGDIEEIDGAGV